VLSDSAVAAVSSTSSVVDGRPASTCPKEVVVHPALRAQNLEVCSNGLMHLVRNNDSNIIIVWASTTSTADGDESKKRKALIVAAVKVSCDNDS